MTETPIDTAFAQASQDPENEDLRLRYYERIIDSEVFLLLEAPAQGQNINPQVFNLDDGTFALGFDTELRLTTFVGQGADYAAFAGRDLVGLLAQNNLGLGMNLEVAPSADLLPVDVMHWLGEMIVQGQNQVAEAQIQVLTPPADVSTHMLTGLDAKLARMGGLADAAYLVRAEYTGGGTALMLAFINAPSAAEPAIRRAINEGVIFAGSGAQNLDLCFVDSGSALAQKLAGIGLRFDIPAADKAQKYKAPL